MKKLIYQLIPLFLLFSLLAACGDIIEDDLSKDTVIMLAPSNGAKASNTAIKFWWEELEGATSYRLQVVSPTFDSITNLLIDEEIVDETQFETTLPSGHYQWTVIGKNFGYETEKKMIFDLAIETDSSISLDGDILVLLAPTQDNSTSNPIVEFKWQSLENADDYNFQLASPDFSNNAFIISNELLTATTVTKTLNEGEYRWRVRGQNSSSVSQFTERRITIDQTPPEPPLLTLPTDGVTVTLPVLLNWTSDTNSTIDTLYVYIDSLATMSVLKLATINTEYSFTNLSSNKFFWRVRTVDNAGNISAFSVLRKFYVQ
ncbi:MAG: hypothetical protein GC192_21030 [Bacteroidetes bacterium]|nr:hypothetical protein [Bacteroidota bacterium]